MSKLAEETLLKIQAWIKLFPDACCDLKINRNPAANINNHDYHVDIEIILIPKNPLSLGITIWVCEDSMGVFLDDFSRAANIGKFLVSNGKEKLACAGTEPVSRIDIEKLMYICDMVSKGKIKISAVVLSNHVCGIYMESVDLNCILNNVGPPKFLAKIALLLHVGKIVPLQVEGWHN